jgi:hypothetical protein
MRRPLTRAVGSLLALLPFAGHTQECPTEQTARRGFVVERGDQQKTEVAIGEGDIVHTTMRYAGRTQLETDLFAGLFSLSRLDRAGAVRLHERGQDRADDHLVVGQNVGATHHRSMHLPGARGRA